jgi:hypothetical protein
VSDNKPKDVDPQLLRESGRASAIQDLADQAKQMGDRAVALEKSTQGALAYEVRRWRRTALLLLVGIACLAGIGLRQLSISSDNKELLEDVDLILEDVETLVTYVEQTEADRGPSPELQEVFRAVFEIRQIVCADPSAEGQAACTALSQPSN